MREGGRKKGVWRRNGTRQWKRRKGAGGGLGGTASCKGGTEGGKAGRDQGSGGRFRGASGMHTSRRSRQGGGFGYRGESLVRVRVSVSV